MSQSPCATCDHHLNGGDKSARRCLDCAPRANFVRFGTAHPVPAPAPITEQIIKEDTMEAKQAQRPDDTPRRKKCKRCGELKPMAAFYKNKQTSDGREGSCKQCKTAARKQRTGKAQRRTPAETPAAELREAFDGMIVRCKTRAAVEAVESGPQPKGAAQDGPERSKAAQYVSLGTRVGMLVSQKQKAYGDSFGRSGAVLRQLFPDGVPPERYGDLLCIVRILDKLFRVATDKAAFGENPYLDIAGYGLLGAGRDGAEAARGDHAAQ